MRLLQCVANGLGWTLVNLDFRCVFAEELGVEMLVRCGGRDGKC
jgi:hypothetical protein